jgi:hypothetical protein
MPISKRPDLQQIEEMLLKSWAAGSYVRIQSVLERMGQQSAEGTGKTNSFHSDHTDHGDSNRPEHGDVHGDHTDHHSQRSAS